MSISIRLGMMMMIPRRHPNSMRQIRQTRSPTIAILCQIGPMSSIYIPLPLPPPLPPLLLLRPRTRIPKQWEQLALLFICQMYHHPRLLLAVIPLLLLLLLLLIRPSTSICICMLLYTALVPPAFLFLLPSSRVLQRCIPQRIQ